MTFKVILIVVVVFIIGSMTFGSLPTFIKALGKLPKSLKYQISDIYHYYKDKKYKIFDNSGIIMYGGLFGTGKTFNIVDYVTSVYNHYDNIEVYSNVTLNDIPYTPFTCFEQITDKVEDGKHRIYVCDEFGSLFNSRNYKNTELTEVQYMTALNQLRKEHKLLLISTQRYGMCDKMFRQVCKEWRECHKLWRFMWYFSFDPYDLEYSLDPRIVKPLSIFPTMTFATDKKRKQYDTHEFVAKFDKPIRITDRMVTDSVVNADYGYSNGAKKKNVHKANRKTF